MLRLAAIAALMPMAATAHAQSLLEEQEQEPAPTPWDQGRVGFSVSLGSQSAFGERYFAVGGGAGYYVLAGLELSLYGEYWFGGGPSVARLTPEVRYVAFQIPLPLKPYAGVFFNHWFVGDTFEDIDSVGCRAGLMFHQGRGLIIGGGVAVERILSTCDDCVEIYPDIILGLTF
jgi:hypothetical protein